MRISASSARQTGRLRRKFRKGLLLLAQLLQGKPDGVLRVAAERLVPKLEQHRDRPWADTLRFQLLVWQPGLRASRDEIQALLRSCQLILPPGWVLSTTQRRRLKILMAGRMWRTGAPMVTCDDWIPREDGGWTWRQKPLWDGDFDKEVGIGAGPILLGAEMIRQMPSSTQGIRGAAWRETLHRLAMAGGGHSHVPLPLIRAPQDSSPAAPAAMAPSRVAASPLVSVLIPTAGFRRPLADSEEILVMNCLRSLVARSHYRNLEVVVIDGGELDDALIKALASVVENGVGPGRWRFLREEGPYSYTHRINRAAAAATGELLLQLNDDTELLDGEGVDALVAALAEPAVGIAGALLLYPDGTVQHAGTAIDNLAPRHVWAGCRPEHLPWGTLRGHRTFHAVTAAVCLCSRSLWNRLGGLSDRFPINYGDVDFCLRAAELGARTVLAPRSRWIHHESASRTVEVPPELPVFAATWGNRLGGNFNVDEYCSAWRQLLAPPLDGY